ncbi:MAG: hypothetical protein R3190_09355, partial [Thermoanaerobaculia bacterium]|nr:hypothetical protein [Thermoanaerobaculia bacterium]
LEPGPRMRSSEYYLRHQRLIEEAWPPGPRDRIAAGHKKDVVVTRRLQNARERIAIYGWHRLDDSPIQPLSLVHGARYADYSHGVRLVFGEVWIDGAPMPLRDALRSAETSSLFTREGPIAPRSLLGLPHAGD